MKKFKFTLGRLGAILFCAIVLFLVIVYSTPIGQEEAKTIAESAFHSAAKHQKMMPSEFALMRVPTQEAFSKHQYVSYEWQSKAHPGCTIEVYVDLKYANGRPIWECK